MVMATAAAGLREHSTFHIIKKGMSDATSPNRSSPTSAHDGLGLQSVLEAEASLHRATAVARATAASRSAQGLPSSLGSSLRTSAFSPRDQLLASMPPSLRASQSLDLSAPRLRAAQSLDLGPPSLSRGTSLSAAPPSLTRGTSLSAAPPSLTRGTSLSAAMPPSLTRGASLTACPPSLTRGTSLSGVPSLTRGTSLTAGPPSLTRGTSLTAGPPSLNRGTSLELAAARRAALGAAAYPSMYDPRRRFLLAQHAAGVFPGGPFGSNFLGAGPATTGPWRNLPNEGVSGQGLEMLRAASLSLPNRMGAVAGMPPPSNAAAMTASATMGSPAGLGAGASLAAAAKSPGFSPEAKESRKRKSKDDDSSDDESAGKVFIPEIRDLDILCGRGGKSNHHFGNKRYRQVVSEMKMMYRSTEAKTVKTDLSRAIVDHVCSYGGRFVKKDDATGKYYLLTKAEARKKTSQALRETKALKWTM
ncbi:expressed unknown protein [Seminavis robusta]|uniref:DUF6824 domain-containing protein n=1 Tax=Seminavis robusta TaxID=568900 RepID=A0A9N8HH93_9STRA|nr:expressed unknown protein [Seminavis robusta]|eukprot:Sro436_g142700.1 n/a (474) ;mRNA; r:52278-53786